MRRAPAIGAVKTSKTMRIGVIGLGSSWATGPGIASFCRPGVNSLAWDSRRLAAATVSGRAARVPPGPWQAMTGASFVAAPPPASAAGDVAAGRDGNELRALQPFQRGGDGQERDDHVGQRGELEAEDHRRDQRIARAPGRTARRVRAGRSLTDSRSGRPLAPRPRRYRASAASTPGSRVGRPAAAMPPPRPPAGHRTTRGRPDERPHLPDTDGPRDSLARPAPRIRRSAGKRRSAARRCRGSPAAGRGCRRAACRLYAAPCRRSRARPVAARHGWTPSPPPSPLPSKSPGKAGRAMPSAPRDGGTLSTGSSLSAPAGPNGSLTTAIGATNASQEAERDGPRRRGKVSVAGLLDHLSPSPTSRCSRTARSGRRRRGPSRTRAAPCRSAPAPAAGGSRDRPENRAERRGPGAPGSSTSRTTTSGACRSMAARAGPSA